MAVLHSRGGVRFWLNMDATFRAHVPDWVKMPWGLLITQPLFVHSTDSNTDIFFGMVSRDVSHSVAYSTDSVALSKYITIYDLVRNEYVEVIGLTPEDFPDCVMSYYEDFPRSEKLPNSTFLEEDILSNDDKEESEEYRSDHSNTKQIRTAAVLQLWSSVWFSDLRRTEWSRQLLESLVRFVKTKPSCEEIGRGPLEFTTKFLKNRHTLSEIVSLGVDFSTPNRDVLRRWILEILVPYVHHVESTIEHLRADPETLVPMYLRDPDAFLREQSRVSPGIVSVTARLKRDLDLDVASPYRGTGMVTKSLLRGDHVTLVLSEANRDSDHFGGHSNSRIVSRRFDPFRKGDSKRLYYDAVTQTIQIEENEFLLGMRRHVVNLFLPSMSREHFSESRQKQFSALVNEEEKWMKLMLHAQTLLMGCVLALFVGIFARRVMPISRHLPDVIVFRTILYSFILSNVLYAISVLAKAPALCDHGIVFMSFTVLRFYLVGRAYFKEKSYFTVRSERSAKNMTGTLSQKYRYPYSTASALLQIVFHLWLLFLQYCIGHQEGGGLFSSESIFQLGQGRMKYPQWPTLAVYLFYPALMLQLYMLSKFRRNDRTALRPHIAVATLGMIIRVVFGHLPLVLRQPYFALSPDILLLLDRVEIMFGHGLYLPLVAWGAVALDCRLATAGNDKRVEGSKEEEEEVTKSIRQMKRQRKTRKNKNTLWGPFKKHTLLRRVLVLKYERMYLAYTKKATSKTRRKYLTLLALAFTAMMILPLFIPFIFQIIEGREMCLTASSQKPEYSELCSKGSSLLHRIDGATMMFFRLAKVMLPIGPRADDAGMDPINVKIPTEYGALPKRKLLYESQIPTWDEDNGEEKLLSVAIFSYLRSETFNPLVDTEVYFDSLTEANEMLDVIAENDTKTLELWPWDEMSSDDAMSRFCFSGLAAHRTRRIDDGELVYETDFDWLHGLDVRAGFERYGATAWFDSDAKLVKIWWSHGQVNLTSSSKRWNHAKWAFRCSALLGVTVADHLIKTHYMGSNFMAASAFENLNAEHPIRRLIRPHTYGANSVNMAASRTLSTSFGLVHRATALTEKALMAGLDASWRGADIKHVHDFEANGMIKTIKSRPELYPYGQDAMRYERVVRRHVERYVNIYYKNDEDVLQDTELVEFFHGLKVKIGTGIPDLTSRDVLISQLTTLITIVTGFHNQVGNVADYFMDITFLSAKIRPNKEVADVQASFQGLNIALMTAMKTPKLMNDFSHLLLLDDHLEETKNAFQTFQKELSELADLIEAENANSVEHVCVASDGDATNKKCGGGGGGDGNIRAWPCASYNPRKMLSSVSV